MGHALQVGRSAWPLGLRFCQRERAGGSVALGHLAALRAWRECPPHGHMQHVQAHPTLPSTCTHHSS